MNDIGNDSRSAYCFFQVLLQTVIVFLPIPPPPRRGLGGGDQIIRSIFLLYRHSGGDWSPGFEVVLDTGLRRYDGGWLLNHMINISALLSLRRRPESRGLK